MGSNPLQAWIFSGRIFSTAYVVFSNSKIASKFISKTAVRIYVFIYLQSFNRQSFTVGSDSLWNVYTLRT